jgi:hypothetical protein
VGGTYDVNLGLFLQAKTKPVIFYAGPFVYLVRGDVKSTVTPALLASTPLSAPAAINSKKIVIFVVRPPKNQPYR